MIGALEGFVQQALKVPPEPEPPAGGSGSLRVFRAGRGFFHYRVLAWIISRIFVFFGIFVGFFMFNEMDGMVGRAFLGLEVLALVLAVLYLPVSFLLVTLDFNMRWYMVSDRSLRIREGILKVQERTMTFSNIQNVAIRQGPLQRFFGIADVEVRTAGGGGASQSGQEDPLAENMHVGYFRGVDNAEEIRDLIMNHLRRLSAAGLGDPDEAADSPEVEATASSAEQAMLQAAQGLLLEVRALRAEASAPGRPTAG